MLTTREVIKTFYNALLQRLKKHRGDWNQNDPSADDYIKNRPFYTDEAKKIVNVPEQKITIPSKRPYAAWLILPEPIEFIVGQTYEVKWDDETYSCVAFDSNGISAIGNQGVFGDGTDTGEPFIMMISKAEGFGRVFAPEAIGTHTVEVTTTKVVTLDRKYLPDTIADKSEVEAAKTTATNAQSTANDAKTAADNAQTTATNAQSTANDAKTAAKTAKTTANDAQSAVITANITAETAKSAAITAKTTAEAAKTAADNAQTTATNAQTTAEAAKTQVARALTVERSGNISAPNNTMDSGTYQRLNLYSKDLHHSAAFAVTESIGLKIFVDRDGGLQSSLSNPSTLQFMANGSSCMRLKGIDELIMNSSTPGSTKEFKITVDDSGTLTVTEV